MSSGAFVVLAAVSVLLGPSSAQGTSSDDFNADEDELAAKAGLLELQSGLDRNTYVRQDGDDSHSSSSDWEFFGDGPIEEDDPIGPSLYDNRLEKGFMPSWSGMDEVEEEEENNSLIPEDVLDIQSSGKRLTLFHQPQNLDDDDSAHDAARTDAEPKARLASLKRARKNLEKTAERMLREEKEQQKGHGAKKNQKKKKASPPPSLASYPIKGGVRAISSTSRGRKRLSREELADAFDDFKRQPLLSPSSAALVGKVSDGQADERARLPESCWRLLARVQSSLPRSAECSEKHFPHSTAQSDEGVQFAAYHLRRLPHFFPLVAAGDDDDKQPDDKQHRAALHFCEDAESFVAAVGADLEAQAGAVQQSQDLWTGPHALRMQRGLVRGRQLWSMSRSLAFASTADQVSLMPLLRGSAMLASFFGQDFHHGASEFSHALVGPPSDTPRPVPDAPAEQLAAWGVPCAHQVGRADVTQSLTQHVQHMLGTDQPATHDLLATARALQGVAQSLYLTTYDDVESEKDRAPPLPTSLFSLAAQMRAHERMIWAVHSGSTASASGNPASFVAGWLADNAARIEADGDTAQVSDLDSFTDPAFTGAPVGPRQCVGVMSLAGLALPAVLSNSESTFLRQTAAAASTWRALSSAVYRADWLFGLHISQFAAAIATFIVREQATTLDSTKSPARGMSLAEEARAEVTPKPSSPASRFLIPVSNAARQRRRWFGSILRELAPCAVPLPTPPTVPVSQGARDVIQTCQFARLGVQLLARFSLARSSRRQAPITGLFNDTYLLTWKRVGISMGLATSDTDRLTSSRLVTSYNL